MIRSFVVGLRRSCGVGNARISDPKEEDVDFGRCCFLLRNDQGSEMLKQASCSLLS